MKSLALVVATLFALVFGQTATPGAAQAAVSTHSCSSDSICLYQWEGFSGPIGTAGRWQSSISNLQGAAGSCINLTAPPAHWPNGDDVNNNSGSEVINSSGVWGDYHVIFYNWVNCNSLGGSFAQGLTDSSAVSDLHTITMDGGVNAYHAITSMGLQFGTFPQ